MKYTIIIVGLLLCFACKNQSSDKGKSEESKSNSEQTESKESSENSEQKSNDEKPMQELAGTWKQAPNGNVEVTGKKSLATIELNLNADGSFTGTEDMMSTHADVKGTWKLDDGKVKLNWNGTELNLEVGSNNSSLTDSQNGINLSR